MYYIENGINGQESNRVQALVKSVCIKGQIFPSKKGTRDNQNQRLYIISDHQRVYRVIGNKLVNINLWRHIWESIIIQGRVNYQKRTLLVDTFHPANSEKINHIDNSNIYDENGYDFELRHFRNLVCNGFNITTTF